MEPDLSPSVGREGSPLGFPGLAVVLLGGPGSGKGTQAELLGRSLVLPRIATGDLFRENLERRTDVGQLAKIYMDKGELVPDAVTNGMVAERVARDDARGGFILDGFPRTLPQAEALDGFLARQGRGLGAVVYIRVPDEAIVERLGGRWVCRLCRAPYHVRFKPPRQTGKCDVCGGELRQRSDDTPSTVRARLKTFHAETEPLVAFYRRNGLLLEVDGQGDPEAVAGRILSALRSARAFPAASEAGAMKGGSHV